MQTSGPWDPWLLVVENSRLLAQRGHSAGTARAQRGHSARCATYIGLILRWGNCTLIFVPNQK